MDIVDKAKLVKHLKEKKAELKAKQTEVEEALKNARESLHDELVMSGLEMVRVPDVGTVTAVTKDFASISNPETFFPFLESIGHSSIVKQTVHAQTLKSWYSKEGKRYIKDPEEVGLRVYSQKDVSFKKN